MNLNNQHDDDIDYWKELEDIDSYQLMINLTKMQKEDPKLTQLQEWIKERQDGILKSYIKGVNEFRQDAFQLSLHDFGLFLFVAMKYKGGLIKGVKPELKPQTTQLQKELEDIYTEDNIENAIKDLGVLTKEDIDNNNNKEG